MFHTVLVTVSGDDARAYGVRVFAHESKMRRESFQAGVYAISDGYHECVDFEAIDDWVDWMLGDDAEHSRRDKVRETARGLAAFNKGVEKE